MYLLLCNLLKKFYMCCKNSTVRAGNWWTMSTCGSNCKPSNRANAIPEPHATRRGVHLP